MLRKHFLHKLTFICGTATYLICINIVGWFSGVYEDIVLYTTLGILTILLVRHAKEVEEIHKNQKRLMLDISHHFQTPLAVFQTRLEQFRTGEPDDGHISALEDSLEELSLFIAEFLHLARLEYTPEYPHTSFDFSRMSTEILEEVGIITENTGIRLTGTVEPNIHILGDPVKLRGAVLELMNNATKYVRSGVVPHILLSVYTEKGSAVVSVEDNGMGIASADVPHIFERFWRAKGAEHRAGSGLGLALAKHIVERHKGTLTATSARGVGTIFTVRLPRIM
jgi:signal transduction histidine kinase